MGVIAGSSASLSMMIFIILIFSGGKLEDAIRAAETGAESARRLIESRPDQVCNLMTCLELLGDLLRDFGKDMEAESVYVEALSLEGVENIERIQLARIKSSLACIYDNNSLIDEAIILYNQAIDIFSSLDRLPHIDIANIRNNLGMLYKNRQDYEIAEENYMIALEIFENNLKLIHRPFLYLFYYIEDQLGKPISLLIFLWYPNLNLE